MRVSRQRAEELALSERLSSSLSVTQIDVTLSRYAEEENSHPPRSKP